MTIQKRVDAAVARLEKSKQEYFELEFDEDDPQVLNPPATAAQLSDVEHRLGAPLPPSYHAFLASHNGWLEFSGGAMLLPSDEHDKPWVAKRMKRIREHLREFADASVLDNAFIVMLGADEKNFAYLDKSKPKGAGELEVVYSDMVDGDLGRFEDFASFLEFKADTMDRLVAGAK